MSDRDRLLALLRERGPAGANTFEIRSTGISGNPSQRVRELEERGCSIEKRPYKQGKRRGKLYVLVEDAEVKGAAGGQPPRGGRKVGMNALDLGGPPPPTEHDSAGAGGESLPGDPGAAPSLFEPEPERALHPLTDQEAA